MWLYWQIWIATVICVVYKLLERGTGSEVRLSEANHKTKALVNEVNHKPKALVSEANIIG